MLFSLGPVMRYELITTSRRRRYYFVRVIYGLLLLSQLWIFFRDWEVRHPSGGSIDQIQGFAEDAFIQFAGVQGLGLLILIPALVAGLIADEHQRKTLHYLLASRLSSAEIVLGKLGARMVHVVAFIALGLPIVSLLMLYGGLNPVNIFYVYIGTSSLVLFVAGFSILISILARRPRDAILATYGLGSLWLLVPVNLEDVSRYTDGVLWWVKPLNDALLLSNPWKVWSTSTERYYYWPTRTTRPGWGNFGFEWDFAWMVGIQTFFGLVFLTLAIAGLRPMRGTSWPGAQPRTGWWTRLSGRWRHFAESRAAVLLTRNELLATRSNRPSCGDDPMLWKERYTRLGGGLKWLGSRPVALFFAVLLGCFLLDVAVPFVGDLISGKWHVRAWTQVNAALRTTSVALAVLAVLPISAAAASSLTSEREQDTWTSLATTLLTPLEIVRAKQLGAIWSARWIGIAVLTIWGAGLLMAAIHPIGLLAGAALLLSAAWLVAATGVLASAFASNSTRALFLTFVATFAFVMLSGWPAFLWASLASYRDMAFLWDGQISTRNSPATLIPPRLIGAAVATAVQSALAGLATIWSVRRLRTTWGRA
jgi:ABC-type transport system involved in multi-copper enzyme maturation permease subunit